MVLTRFSRLDLTLAQIFERGVVTNQVLLVEQITDR